MKTCRQMRHQATKKKNIELPEVPPNSSDSTGYVSSDCTSLTNFTSRISVQKLCSVVSLFSNFKRSLVSEIGFGGLLDLKIAHKINLKFSASLMDRVDPETCTLVLGENRKIRAASGEGKEWPGVKTTVPKGGAPPPPPGPPPAPAVRKNPDEICHNCNLPGHFAPRCPTVRCEKCNKLGHMAQLCQTLRPWECVPFLCGFQSPGQGFFYIPDMCVNKQNPEKTNNVVITILEGAASVKEIEAEFNGFFAHMSEKKKKWRCTARPISPSQYVMRFPNAREVERACCYCKRLPLKNGSSVVSITPWSASVSAKGVMEKAWVRVKNIPIDKRCVEHVSYAGALVGLTLEVDGATLHKPEYVRILLGCREVSKIPPSAEGMLGEQFYDFFYEVEKVVVGSLDRNQSSVDVENDASPSGPKRARMDSYPASSTGQGETSNSFVGSYPSQECDKGSQRMSTISENEDEKESDDEDHTELLIETMAREHDKASGSPSESHVGDMCSEKMGDAEKRMGLKSPAPTEYKNKDFVEWPNLPHIVPFEGGASEVGKSCSNYTVESPSGSPIHDTGDDGGKRTRLQYQKLMRVEEAACNRVKKRDYEGLLKGNEKEEVQMGIKKLSQVAMMLADRAPPRGRLFLGDGAGA